MSERKLLLGILFATVLVLVGGVFFLAQPTGTPVVTASENAKAEVVETDFSWGNIPINGGKVQKVFIFKNTGQDALQITNIRTSCHCTVARLTSNGKTSQDFGMGNTSNWVGVVDPGKEATLTVIFDPAFHGPQGIGSVTRYVSVNTNDKSNKEIVFTLTGTVIK